MFVCLFVFFFSNYVWTKILDPESCIYRKDKLWFAWFTTHGFITISKKVINLSLLFGWNMKFARIIFFFHLTRFTIVIFRAAWRLWERMARTFRPCVHEISQKQLDVSGSVSTQVSFVESFCIYCFLLLFIVHSFYFSKESVHDSGKQRRVGSDQ